MKYILVIISLFLAINCGYASKFQTSQYSNYNSQSQSNYSSQIACFYNDYVYFFHNGYNTINGISKFQVSSGNKVTSMEFEEFPNEDYAFSPLGSAMCTFNNALFVFSSFERNQGYYGYYYRTDQWHADSYHTFDIPGNYEVKRATAAVLKDTLGLFYVDYFGDLYYHHMTKDMHMSEPKKLLGDVIKENRDEEWEYNVYGNIACAPYVYKNELVYVLAITSNDHKKIYFYLYNSKGEKLKEYTHKTKYAIMNVALVDGSVDGAGKGRPIQCFYSYTGSAYSCQSQIARFDFYPETGNVKYEEYLKMYPSVDHNSFLPACSEYIHDENSSDLTKKIVMAYFDFKKSFMNNTYQTSVKFYVWDSDKLKKISEVKDTVLQTFTKLVGVVEGVPPMALNGHNVIDAHGNGFDDISEFSLVRSYESDSESKHGITSTVKFSSEFYGISTGFSRAVGKETSIEKKYSEYNTTKLVAYQGQYLLKILLRPKFTKTKFAIQDYSGKAYDTISTITCTGIEFEDVPDLLSKTKQNLNDTVVTTYIDRNIDFNAYDHVYQTAFQYVSGAKLNYQVMMSEELSHSDSYSMSFSPGKLKDNDSLGFFRLATNTQFESNIEISTTTTFGKEVGLNLHFPGGDKEGDIISYVGLFHWMKWTEGENNWWVIEGLENDKPWCMTYEIFSTKKYSK
jgi:hypothetical protein